MIINHSSKSIYFKIVYFGPALSGKTTTLKWIFGHFGKKHEVISIDSSVEHMFFFDYGTITFKEQDWLLKLHVYSTTGQDFYAVTRPITWKRPMESFSWQTHKGQPLSAMSRHRRN